MAKRKKQEAANTPRLAFGESVLNEDWARRAIRDGSREDALGLFGMRGVAVWDEFHGEAAAQSEEGPEPARDPLGVGASLTDQYGNEYYDALYYDDSGAGAGAGEAALTVSDADLETVEEALRLLDLSRRDSGGNCWYCGTKGNPAEPEDHASACGWRRLDALRYAIGAALTGEGHDTAAQGAPGGQAVGGPRGGYVRCAGCGLAVAHCQCLAVDDVPF